MAAAKTAPARTTTVLIAAAVLETTSLAILAAAGVLGGAAALLVHALTLSFLLKHLVGRHRAGSESTLAMLGLIASSVLGPLGAIGTAVVGLALRGNRRPERLLDEWYARIAMATELDAVSKLSDSVRVGRAVGLAGPVPSSFENIVAAGPVSSRQAVLGLIARHFDPEYLATLKVALRSPLPSIRVQAAAVAAHLQPDVRSAFADAMNRLDSASRSSAQSLQLLRTLYALEDSGLLDEGDRKRGEAVCSRLGDVVFSGVARGERLIPANATIDVARGLDETVERLLVERRRFDLLRAWRSRRRVLERHPKARVRRIGGVTKKAAA